MTEVPNSRAWPGTPPTTPDSTVRVMRSAMPSSEATLGIIAEMPTPRFTTSRGRSSKAARLATTRRTSSGSGAMLEAGTTISPQRAGS